LTALATVDVFEL